MEKKRIRDFGIVPGRVKTGKRNAITDVPGVLVGHCTVNTEENHTGVTVIIPGPDNAFANHYTAAAYVHNGFGKSAGLVQVEELGTLETPIALTNTLNVGKVWDALAGIVIEQCQNDGLEPMSINPVAGECNDCRINQIQKRAVGEKEVRQAFAVAAEEFEEGDVGAGADIPFFELLGSDRKSLPHFFFTNCTFLDLVDPAVIALASDRINAHWFQPIILALLDHDTGKCIPNLSDI